MGIKDTEEYKEKLRLGMRERVRKLKRQSLEYKGGKCEICGYDKCPQAMHFHHKDPNEKDFSLSHVTCRKFNDSIKEELDKCILLCSNCHAEVHWAENSEKLEVRKEKLKTFDIPERAYSRMVACTFCGKEFLRAPCNIKEQNYCSNKCRVGLQNSGWPNEEELIQLYKKHNIKSLVPIIGKTYNSIKKRKQKLRKEGKI